MARTHRMAPGGLVEHVCNRGSRRGVLFNNEDDYTAFLRLLAEGRERFEMRILAFCLMPNHWHLLLWPEQDGDLSRFMHWLTTTHASHWRMDTETRGEGAVYQGRYRNVVMEDSWHLLVCWRYIEFNPVEAHLVREPWDWWWSSAAIDGPAQLMVPIDQPPFPRPANWLQLIDEPQYA